MRINNRIGIFVVLLVGLWIVSPRGVHADDPCLNGCGGVYSRCLQNADEGFESCITQMEFNRDQCYIAAEEPFERCMDFCNSFYVQWQGCTESCYEGLFMAQNACEDVANIAGANCEGIFSTAASGCAVAYTNCADACPTPTP